MIVRPFKIMRVMILMIILGIVAAYPIFTSSYSHIISPGPPSARTRAIRAVYGELRDNVPGTTPTEAYSIAEAIVDESNTHGFDPLFIVAVIETESRYEIEAVSKSGARGLMQVLPSTFRAFSQSARMFDPVENVRVGIRYLASLSGRFRRPDTLLLAYNAGPGGARGIINGDRDHNIETKNYAPKVLNKYGKLLKKYGEDPRKASKLYLAKAK